MKFSDELLIAFVNGELAEPARAAVERALRADPAIAARVAQHRARRSRVYGGVAGGREGGHITKLGFAAVREDGVRALAESGGRGLLLAPACVIRHPVDDETLRRTADFIRNPAQPS